MLRSPEQAGPVAELATRPNGFTPCALWHEPVPEMQVLRWKKLEAAG